MGFQLPTSTGDCRISAINSNSKTIFKTPRPDWGLVCFLFQNIANITKIPAVSTIFRSVCSDPLFLTFEQMGAIFSGTTTGGKVWRPVCVWRLGAFTSGGFGMGGGIFTLKPSVAMEMRSPLCDQCGVPPQHMSMEGVLQDTLPCINTFPLPKQKWL